MTTTTSAPSNANASSGHDSDNSLLKTMQQQAIHWLARREHSEHELRQKLSRLHPSEEAIVGIDLVLSKLQQAGYQSDQRFAESLLRWRFNRGKGPLYIKQELRQHQLSEEDCRFALEQYQEEDWQQLCYRVWQAKYAKEGEKNASTKEQQKQYRFLSSRGFSPIHWQTFLKWRG